MNSTLSKTEFIKLAKEKGYSSAEIDEQLNLSAKMVEDGLNPSYEVLFSLPPQKDINEDPPFKA